MRFVRDHFVPRALFGPFEKNSKLKQKTQGFGKFQIFFFKPQELSKKISEILNKKAKFAYKTSK